MVYAWKPTARVQLDAEQCGAVFETLEQTNELTPARVVEAAKPKSSPLHDGFEWNDKVAASEHRMQQARYLLRSIVIVRDDAPSTDDTPLRAFVTITEDDADAKPHTVFCSLEAALSDPVKRQQVLARALKELNAWQRRYAALDEFASVIAAISSFVPHQVSPSPSDIQATA